MYVEGCEMKLITTFLKNEAGRPPAKFRVGSGKSDAAEGEEVNGPERLSGARERTVAVN